MENFIEFKEALIKEAVSKNACEPEVKRVKECQTWNELKVVIIDNIVWLVDNEVKLPDEYYKSSLREFTVVNGVLHGEYKDYYDNGQLWEHSHYKNGVQHGECKLYHDNGQLRVYEHYENGELHGEYKEWYDNGQLKVEENFVSGQLHGKYLSYDESGKLIHKYYYTKGILNNFRTFIFKYFNI